MKSFHKIDDSMIDDNRQKVKAIDDAVILLMSLTSLARFKNLEMKNSFSDEFFKGVKKYFK